MKKIEKLKRLILALVLLAPSWTWAASDKNTVVVTIKPLAMLAYAVVGDELPIKVLMPGNVSPHDYALAFSDVRAVKAAELVIWVGPELESAMRKPLSSTDKAGLLTLAEIPDMHWPEKGEETGRQELDEEEHHHELSHAHERDPHLWLNPENGRVAARAIAGHLNRLFPEKKHIFADNLQKFEASLDALDSRARDQLVPLSGRGFVVTHDGYSHFVQHYGLHQLAAVQVVSGRQQGARHYSELLALGEDVACVFTEVQLNNKGALQLAEQLGARTREIDPMGQQIVLSRSSYLELIQEMVADFAGCLGEGA